MIQRIFRGQGGEFPFVRTFILFSLVLIGGATALATWLVLAEVRYDLQENAVEYAAEIAGNLYNQVEEEFLEPRRQRGDPGGIDPGDAECIGELGRVVGRSIFNHRVRRLYFFDPDGRVIFGMPRQDIGRKISPDNQNFNKALGGEIASIFKLRNAPMDLTGEPAGEDLLETYVPVGRSEEGRGPGDVAVIEIYQGVEDLRADLQTARNRILLTSLGTSGALFLVFSFFIVLAGRAIQRRRRDLVRSNAALQELSRSLETQVQQRTRQLIERQKLASLGVLAAGVAHELNTPLGTIAACSEGSLDRLRSEEPEREQALDDVRRYLALIDAEAFRCKSITRNLLDFSRQSPIEAREDLDLDALTRQSLDLFRLAREHRDIQFVLDLDAGSSRIQGDPSQIRQVIHNLLENAVHAVKDTPRPRIVIRSRSRPDRVVFECEDNGAGVDPEIRDQVFEPFFTTKSAGEGTGLGLALSYSIISRHGGTLEIASAEGSRNGGGGGPGALFRFTLPRNGGSGVEEV